MPHLHLPSSGKHSIFLTSNLIPAREGASVGIKRTSFGGLWPLKPFIPYGL